ncbi:MAG: helix-hairpin-helix domain-containing protein [Bacillota bacterium]
MLPGRNYEKILIIIIIIMILIISGTIYINSGAGTEILLEQNIEDSIAEPAEAKTTESEQQPQTVDEYITVYICGCVKRPGNIEIKPDTRLGDALELIGGASEEADLTAVNLAHKLSDEEMIYIPKKGEIINDMKNVIPGYVSKNTALKYGKININTASKSELESLPGVGPSTADKIIAYRNKNGAFKTIEEIMKVTGIGEKKYASLKEYIAVE